jgi:hypothetical protein
LAKPQSTNAPDAPLTISIDALAAKLSEEQRLRVAKALVVAAFKLCPKEYGGSYVDPAALDLATFMNGCVTALLVTLAERQRAESWHARQEQHGAIHARGLH